MSWWCQCISANCWRKGISWLLFAREYSLLRAMEGPLCYELLRYIMPHQNLARQELKEEDAEDGYLEGSNPWCRPLNQTQIWKHDPFTVSVEKITALMFKRWVVYFFIFIFTMIICLHFSIFCPLAHWVAFSKWNDWIMTNFIRQSGTHEQQAGLWPATCDMQVKQGLPSAIYVFLVKINKQIKIQLTSN